MAIMVIYVYLYSNLCWFLVQSGLVKIWSKRRFGVTPQLFSLKPRSGSEIQGENLVHVISTQFFMQVGLLVLVPTLIEIGVESGIVKAVFEVITIQIQLSDGFFLFSLGTKAHHFGHTIMYRGRTKYRATGRGFVINHEKFAEIYRLYSRSHFVKAMEILLILIYFKLAAPGFNKVVSSSMFILVASWLYIPFIFNPLGFSWNKIAEDWEDWLKWLYSPLRLGISASDSWQIWWYEGQEPLKSIHVVRRVARIILALRFFAIQIGFAELVTVDKKMAVRLNQLFFVFKCLVSFHED